MLHLLLDAQPASITERTSIPNSARITTSATSSSRKTYPTPNGNAIKAAALGTRTIELKQIVPARGLVAWRRGPPVEAAGHTSAVRRDGEPQARAEAAKVPERHPPQTLGPAEADGAVAPALVTGDRAPVVRDTRRVTLPARRAQAKELAIGGQRRCRWKVYRI